jgi:hypothetical protein
MSSTPSSSKSAKANKARASKRAAAKKSTNKEKEVTTFDDDVSDSIPPSIGGDSAALPGATQTVPEHKGTEEHDNASVSTMRSGSSLTSALSQAEMFRIDSLIILFNDELPGVLASLAHDPYGSVMRSNLSELEVILNWMTSNSIPLSELSHLLYVPPSQGSLPYVEYHELTSSQLKVVNDMTLILPTAAQVVQAFVHPANGFNLLNAPGSNSATFIVCVETLIRNGLAKTPVDVVNILNLSPESYAHSIRQNIFTSDARPLPPPPSQDDVYIPIRFAGRGAGGRKPASDPDKAGPVHKGLPSSNHVASQYKTFGQSSQRYPYDEAVWNAMYAQCGRLVAEARNARASCISAEWAVSMRVRDRLQGFITGIVNLVLDELRNSTDGNIAAAAASLQSLTTGSSGDLNTLANLYQLPSIASVWNDQFVQVDSDGGTVALQQLNILINTGVAKNPGFEHLRSLASITYDGSGVLNLVQQIRLAIQLVQSTVVYQGKNTSVHPCTTAECGVFQVLVVVRHAFYMRSPNLKPDWIGDFLNLEKQFEQPSSRTWANLNSSLSTLAHRGVLVPWGEQQGQQEQHEPQASGSLSGSRTAYLAREAQRKLTDKAGGGIPNAHGSGGGGIHTAPGGGGKGGKGKGGGGGGGRAADYKASNRDPGSQVDPVKYNPLSQAAYDAHIACIMSALGASNIADSVLFEYVQGKHFLKPTPRLRARTILTANGLPDTHFKYGIAFVEQELPKSSLFWKSYGACRDAVCKSHYSKNPAGGDNILVHSLTFNYLLASAPVVARPGFAGAAAAEEDTSYEDSIIANHEAKQLRSASAMAKAETDKVDAVDFRAFQAYKAMCSRGQTSLDVTRPAESASATDKGLDFWSKMSREPPGGN